MGDFIVMLLAGLLIIVVYVVMLALVVVAGGAIGMLIDFIFPGLFRGVTGSDATQVLAVVAPVGGFFRATTVRVTQS